MGRIREALQQLNEIETTHHKLDDIKLKHKLHLPNLEYEDELDDNGDPVIDQETGRKKQVRVPAGFIYIITINDAEDDQPKKFLCKIGYAKDVNIRLGQFNRDAGNPAQLNWFARIPIYRGEYDNEANEFKPIKGETDQLDKRIHDVIDTVVDTADNYMQRKYNSTQAIDLRKLDVNGHRKEWYLMSPQQAVNIVEAIIDTQQPGMYGKTEYNLQHPLYTPTHQTKTVDDKGNVVTRTTANKGNKYNIIQRTGKWNGWWIGKGGGGNYPIARFYPSNGRYWISIHKRGDMSVGIDKNKGDEQDLTSFQTGEIRQTNDYYYRAGVTREDLLSTFPSLPAPWIDYLIENQPRWNVANGESDKHMQALNDMIPENQIEKEDE